MFKGPCCGVGFFLASMWRTNVYTYECSLGTGTEVHLLLFILLNCFRNGLDCKIIDFLKKNDFLGCKWRFWYVLNMNFFRDEWNSLENINDTWTVINFFLSTISCFFFFLSLSTLTISPEDNNYFPGVIVERPDAKYLALNAKQQRWMKISLLICHQFYTFFFNIRVTFERNLTSIVYIP